MRRPLLAFILFAAVFVLVLPLPCAAAKSSISMQLAMDEKAEKPQKVVWFPATFTSSNNVRVTFDVVRAEAGLMAPLPNPIELSPARSEGATVPFAIQTPYHNGYVQETGEVAYRATPSDGSAPLEWTVKVHTRGFYLPGPGVAVLLGTIAVVASLVRRR